MRYLYNLFCYILVPFVLVRLLWQSRKVPGYRHRVRERFGYFDCPEIYQNGIWVHAVSVGETLVAVPLIRAIQARHPNVPITLTNMTPTGAERAKALLGDTIFHVYVPYDLPNVVQRFLKKVKPRLLILIETELWPNMLHYCHATKIKILLANARLSERSAKRYARISRIVRIMLRQLDAIAAQTEDDAKRFEHLGISSNKIHVTGSIKFDMQIPASALESTDILRMQLGINKKIWVAASTHPGEEKSILEAFLRVRERFTDCLLILVPRHPERASDIAKLCRAQALPVALRSKNEFTDQAVLLVDTMGELMSFYSIAHVVFVGGSLVSTGGHNLLEPALFSLPIISGPHLFNFAQAALLLEKAEALTIINNEKELACEVIKFLENEELSEEYGQRACQVVAENRGALDRHIKIIFALFNNSAASGRDCFLNLFRLRGKPARTATRGE
ncbi:MAG TPA: lipid IV(A) 3-deoxy-D-manno-octulosonic acid transferase, partial [Gammaproteobacteria bacterium]|nr:lipid IV(A) 3-deoxy-D-manno-octulosonic acid transferase [Gammaproteobacteria bacterium]